MKHPTAITVLLLAGLAPAQTLLLDIHPGTAGSPGYNNIETRFFVDSFGTIFFSADDGTHGDELWRTDGTAQGTSLVADLRPGSLGANPTDLTLVDDTVYFHAYDGTHNGIFASNGTAATTGIAIPNVSASSLVGFNGSLLYTDSIQNVLYRYDGPGGTPQALGGGVDEYDEIVRLDHRMVYCGWQSGAAAELFVTDGTPGGTSLLVDIQPGWGASRPLFLQNLGGEVYFSADDGVHGRELWATDGTSAGTRMVQDIRTGSSGSNPSDLCVVGDELFFMADDGTHGRELWATDGTGANTRLVLDIVPGSGSSVPRELVALGDDLIFSAYTSSAGYEPWRSDGTAQGTTRLRDIRAGSQGSDPARLTAVGERVFFAAGDSTHGSEPWATDGTPAGTVRIADIEPGSVGSHPNRFSLAHGHLLFFAKTAAAGVEPYRHDPGATSAPIGRGSPWTSGITVQNTGTAHVGASVTVEVYDGPPSAGFGAVLAGAPASGPQLLPGGAHGYIRLAGMQTLGFTPANNGGFSYTLSVPAQPSLVGARIAVQSALFPSTTSRGYEVSNGTLLVPGL